MQIYRWHSSLRDCLEMTPEVLLIIWRLNVYHHISFCLLVASISSSWLLCMAQHISFWGFLMKISREYGASIVYRKWEPLTSTLEEDYDRKCTGHRSHISLLATLTHSLHDYSQTLFCLKRAELLFLLQLFSFWMGEGLFHVMMLMEFCVVWSVAFWMTDDY